MGERASFLSLLEQNSYIYKDLPSCAWICLEFYFLSGLGIDILKLVAAQVGSQWKDIYQFLCNASEREVAAFSNGYTADHERAYAALQHWTIRGPEASLAQLISALRQHRRNDVVEKIRGLMEDTAQVLYLGCWSFQLTFHSLIHNKEKYRYQVFWFTHISLRGLWFSVVVHYNHLGTL